MNLSQQHNNTGMAEPEPDLEPGQSDTECGTTNFPHRRHYAVRRKLGRAKTARLATQTDQAPPADQEEIKSSAGDKDWTESSYNRPEEEESDGGQSNEIDDQSDEDDEQTDDPSDNDDYHQETCVCHHQEFYQDDGIKSIISRPVPVITIQPGSSIDMLEQDETFYGPLLTTSSSLLYPVDERDAISSAAFLAHACR